VNDASLTNVLIYEAGRESGRMEAFSETLAEWRREMDTDLDPRDACVESLGVYLEAIDRCVKRFDDWLKEKAGEK
jgi:CRISPR/Cas system CSM-associated protein Csm2 small subunit